MDENGVALCGNHHVAGVHSKGVEWLVKNIRQERKHKVEMVDGEIFVNGVLLKSIAMKKEGVYEVTKDSKEL